MDIKERIIALLNEIGKGVYEKDMELRLGMLAALAGDLFRSSSYPVASFSQTVIQYSIDFAFVQASTVKHTSNLPLPQNGHRCESVPCFRYRCVRKTARFLRRHSLAM